jgi:hypothetical protein
MNLDSLFNEPFTDYPWNSPLEFGKYKGRRFSEVFLMDPGWIVWAVENTTRIYITPELRDIARNRDSLLRRTSSKIEQVRKNEVDRCWHSDIADLRRRLVPLRSRSKS